MKCDKYRDALVDGAAGGKVEDSLAEHLEVCTRCRMRRQQEHSLFAAIDDALCAKMKEMPRDGFLAGVRAQIWKEAPPKTRWNPMWALASVTLVLTLMAVVHPWVRQPKQTVETGSLKAPRIGVQQTSGLPESGQEPTRRDLNAMTRTRQRLQKQSVARRAPHREPEVLVPPDEGKAFAHFVARLRQRDEVAQAFVKPEPSSAADEHSELPQILPVEIARLQLKPLIWEKGR